MYWWRKNRSFAMKAWFSCQMRPFTYVVRGVIILTSFGLSCMRLMELMMLWNQEYRNAISMEMRNYSTGVLLMLTAYPIYQLFDSCKSRNPTIKNSYFAKWYFQQFSDFWNMHPEAQGQVGIFNYCIGISSVTWTWHELSTLILATNSYKYSK